MKWSLVVVPLLLAGISLTTLNSIAPELVGRQLLYFLVGFAAFFLLQRINLQQLISYSTFLYISLTLLLLGMIFFAASTRATVRWINLAFGFRVQPSQFVPLIVGLLIVNRWSSWELNNWKDLLFFLGIIILPTALVFFQPDLGTSLVILVSLGSTLLLSKVNTKKLATLTFLATISIVFAWFFLLKPYQRARISVFGGDSASNQASSYNARQALIAVGSGSMYGRGLGAGVQSHLRFLPERQTDFVFASIAEEWGFVGSALLVILYFSVIIYLLSACIHSKKVEHQVLLLILASNLFLQVLINIGMNIGLLPITGLTLPLVSYGGSSVVSFMMFFGLIYKLFSQIETGPALEIK